MSDDAPAEPPKPFGRSVAEVYESLKGDLSNKQNINDQVREQVNSDIEKAVEKYRNYKY